MNFWEENKPFVVIMGIVLVAFIYLWPTLIGEWLAPWKGAVVVRPHRETYAKWQRDARIRDKDKQKVFHPQGEAVAVALARDQATKGNEVLLANYEEMNHWMSFVPRFPFRIPGVRTAENDRQRYVVAAYAYARDGEFPCDEFEIRDFSDGVVWLAATRNIVIKDSYFGLRNMEKADEIDDPDTVITQIALIHELGHLVIRSGVDAITAIQPGNPYPWGIDQTPTATAYPVTVRIKCNLETLLRVVHALDGAHGVVREVRDLGVAAAAAAPVAPAPKKPAVAVGGEEPDDNAPGPAPKEAPAPEAVGTRLVVEFFGKPSLHRAGTRRGTLKERVTVFRPAKDDPHKLDFVANGLLRQARRDGKALVEVEPISDQCWTEKGEKIRNTVQVGDLAATRFFLVRSIKVKSVEATLKTDDDGFPTEVNPAHLDAELSVAAVQFKKVEIAKIAATAATPGKTDGGTGTRKYKKPGRRF